MPDNYRLVETVKSRVVGRTPDSTVFKPEDIVSKVEYSNGREIYENGFTDYHKGGEG